MKIKYLLVFISVIGCTPSKKIEEKVQMQSFQKITYEHPIDYKPLTYICYKTNVPIEIDGKLDDEAWQKTKPTADFQDIQGELIPDPPFQTNVKMLWDDNYFYFGAYLEEPHIWGKLTERDTVIFHDNDFEIFIDPDGDSHNYFEFEVNALNTIWDLLLLKPYRDRSSLRVLNAWDVRDIQSAVYINGTINTPTDIDSFWTVEAAIPWKALNEVTPKSHQPKNGVQWRINFSRVNWHMENVNGDYQKKKDKNNKKLSEENWVWSPQGYINMHAPETWGFVQFSAENIGNQEVEFVPLLDEEIKWALRLLYHQQRHFYHQNKVFATTLEQLTIPEVSIQNYKFQPEIALNLTGYAIFASSVDDKYFWIIKDDGQVFKHKK